jgi:hypothetical protein
MFCPYCTRASTPTGKLPKLTRLPRWATYLLHLMFSHQQSHLRQVVHLSAFLKLSSDALQRLLAVSAELGTISPVALLAHGSARAPGPISPALLPTAPVTHILCFQLFYPLLCCHGFISAASAIPPEQLSSFCSLGNAFDNFLCLQGMIAEV